MGHMPGTDLCKLAPRDGLLGAARLAPSGSPCGRSTSLRDVVEPTCCLSAVRICCRRAYRDRLAWAEKICKLAPRDGLLGAARLAPSGSPFGRSTSLRDVVEPTCCLSAVRIAVDGRTGIGWRGRKKFANWLPGTDYSALRASPLRGRPAGDQRRCATLSNRLVVCRRFELPSTGVQGSVGVGGKILQIGSPGRIRTADQRINSSIHGISSIAEQDRASGKTITYRRLALAQSSRFLAGH